MADIHTDTETQHQITARLPRNYATRWNAARKAAVVQAVDSGALPLSNALERYRLSRSEFASWQESYAAQGERGLMASHLAQLDRHAAG